MHVVPNTPTSVVATLTIAASPSEGGIALFNDGGLVTYIPAIASQFGSPSVSLDSFTFNGSDASRVYGLPVDAGYFFAIVALDSSGLHYKSPIGSTPMNPPTGSLVVSDGMLLYTNNGEVWDPQSRKLLHTYKVSNTLVPSVVPDTPQGTTYFMDSSAQYDQRSAMAIRGFDQSTLAETGRLSFTQDPQSYFPIFSTDLLRWGTNGFAFRFSDLGGLTTSNDSVVLVTSSITAASNLNPAPKALTLAPGSVAFGGSDFTLTVTGTGFIPGSTVEWNGTSRITTFVSATELTAVIYASDIAAPGAQQVVVESPGPGGGQSGALSFNVTGTAPGPGQLTLAPGTLTFVSQTVGTKSAPQTATLQNAGQDDITGVAISVAGGDASSFTESDTCTATLTAGATCQVNVVFAPQTAEAASATLSVASSANGSPQTVALNGTAAVPAPFTVGTPPNGSGSSTVTAGQTASYSLVLTPSAGYSGTLSMSCGNIPAHAACTFTPSSLSVSNGSAVNFSLAVSTTDTQAVAFPALLRGTGPLLGLCLLPFWWRRRGSGLSALLCMFSALLLAAIAGCGGGISNPPPTTAPSALKVAPGTYTIQIISTDGMTTAKTPLSLVVQ